MGRTGVTAAVMVAALGLGAGGLARADVSEGQAPVAESTMRLERAFSAEFVDGKIDRAALAPLVDGVLESVPEAVRPRVASRVDRVLDTAERLTSTMSDEERAQVARARPEDPKAVLRLVNAWGWPIGEDMGWGGLGAFGFPTMNGGCIPSGGGYAYPYGFVGGRAFGVGFQSAQTRSLRCGSVDGPPPADWASVGP